MEEKRNFFKRNFKAFIVLACSIVTTFLSMGIAHGIQTGFGSIDVTVGKFLISDVTRTDNQVAAGENGYYVPSEDAEITYKLYRPKEATKDNKAEAVLLLHGYQNDHETSAAYAIELARRGAVVLAIDEYGHGGTNVGIADRGYVSHKVTVNYADGVEIKDMGGQTRYKVLLNFSNLSFFNSEFTKSADGLSLKDTSMGGIAAYAYLSTLEFVNPSMMAVSGHSMGTWASWTVSALYSGTPIAPRATVLQCGELFYKSAYDSDNISFNNVLLLQAKWDEFNYFRDYEKHTVDDSFLDSPLRKEFLTGSKDSERVAWDTTYQDSDAEWADGKARRMELLYTNHRLTTHDGHGMRVALEWFTKAFSTTPSVGATSHMKASPLASNNHVYMIKECLVLLATLSAIVSMFPVFLLVCEIPFFRRVRGKIPAREEKAKSGWKWWKGALITMGVAAVTYPFCTQLGHGLFPFPESVFRMTIGNGFFVWYLICIIIMVCTTLIPYLIHKKKNKPNPDAVHMGLAREENPHKIDWALFGKSVLVALIMILFMYSQVVICEKAFMLDFRFIWPFFKGFDWTRLLQFMVYIPMFMLFYVLNNSKIFASLRHKNADAPGFKGFLSAWWRNALCMCGGILILMLIEYIPFFIGVGPGVDLLFSPTFGGPFMSLMIVFVPQVIVFSVISTYCYRKTGSVYLGATIIAILACWIVTGGSAML